MELFGRTLTQIDFRAKFGMNVLLVRKDAGGLATTAGQASEPEPPPQDYCFQPGDRLVVFGQEKSVSRLQST